MWFSIKDEMGPAPVCWGCLTHNGHNWLLRANKMLRDSKDTINSHPTAADSWFTLKIKIYVIWILVNTTHLSTELFHWTFSTSCLLSVEKTLAAYVIFLELNSCKRENEKIREKTKTEKVYLSENILRLSQPAAAWQPGCELIGRELGNGARMKNWKERGIGDTEMKWRERGEIERERNFQPLHFLFFLSFSLISSQFTAFFANVAKILT